MLDRDKLETLYHTYNRREFVHPDPLEFLYQYPDLCDREIVAFIASSLAYGRVAQILKSVSFVLGRMMPSPSVFLKEASHNTMRKTFSGFKHRFTTGRKLSLLLFGIKRAMEKYGSLQACFLEGLRAGDETLLPALSAFAGRLTACAGGPLGHMVPLPDRGSACKRLNLFLRWMVRRDLVDPGGWDLPASKLIVPLDTHMQTISLLLGITGQRHADMRMALEVTEAFRTISPDDPVKYDFCLTRLGIRGPHNGVAVTLGDHLAPCL